MGTEYEQDLVEVRRDGARVCVIEQQQPADMADREPMIILTLLDITERVEAEAALRGSEQRLALAMAAHEVGVFEWDVATEAPPLVAWRGAAARASKAARCATSKAGAR